MKLVALVFFMAMALSSCSSTHNLKSGEPNHLGGGHQVGPEVDGKFHIEAKTNFAPWENLSGARTMWAKLAQEACGHSDYTEEEVEEYSYETVPALIFIKYIVTVKKGVAACKKSHL